jgi:hypothetical protein
MGTGAAPAGGGLDELVAGLQRAAPRDRIDLRDPVLAHGTACVGPLARLAKDQPGLRPTVVSWLEVLAKRQEAARPAVRRQLALIARAPGGESAREALVRLGGLDAAPKEARPGPRRQEGPSPAQSAVRARIEVAAREGRTITYGELLTNRAVIGGYLHAISLEEAAAGRPPLAALVVSRTSGRPGAGFLQAMQEIGYVREAESEAAMWKRAVADVLAWWRTGSDEASAAGSTAG